MKHRQEELLPVRPTAPMRKEKRKRMAIVKLFALHANAIKLLAKRLSEKILKSHHIQ